MGDYVEGHLCGKLCDVMMYNAIIIYSSPSNRRWRSTARNDGIVHSPLRKYFGRDVLGMMFPFCR